MLHREAEKQPRSDNREAALLLGFKNGLLIFAVKKMGLAGGQQFYPLATIKMQLNLLVLAWLKCRKYQLGNTVALRLTAQNSVLSEDPAQGKIFEQPGFYVL